MRKRLVIDWIRNIGTCDECGYEKTAGMGFYITNAQARDWCPICQEYTDFTIIAHELGYWRNQKMSDTSIITKVGEEDED